MKEDALVFDFIEVYFLRRALISGFPESGGVDVQLSGKSEAAGFISRASQDRGANFPVLSGDRAGASPLFFRGLTSRCIKCGR